MKTAKIILSSIIVLLFCTPFNACAAENQDYAQQPNGYEHHIGDAVFYTEHALEKYIMPDPNNPGFSIIDSETMLYDIWNTNGGIAQVSNGYVLSDGSSFTAAVSYDYADGNDDAHSHYSASTYYFVVSKTGEQQYGTKVIVHDEERPYGGWLIVKGDRRGFGFSPDMAALLLYVLEQTESNPRSNIAGELSLPSNYECSY